MINVVNVVIEKAEHRAEKNYKVPRSRRLIHFLNNVDHKLNSLLSIITEKLKKIMQKLFIYFVNI